MRAMARTMARKNDQGRPRWELSEILRTRVLGAGAGLAAGVVTAGVEAEAGDPPDEVSGVIEIGAAAPVSAGADSPAAAAWGVPGAGGVKLPATLGPFALPTPTHTTS